MDDARRVKGSKSNMEKTPGKSGQGATSGSKSSHGSRVSRSSRNRHPAGMPETPPVSLVSCDPSTTNQMLQSWYNYSMYNMFLNAVANQAAVADMMNRSQMQLMPDLTSPKPGVPPHKKGSPVPGVPTSQSHSSHAQRHTSSHTHSSAPANNTATTTSRSIKPSLPRKDASNQPASKLSSLSASTSSSRTLHRGGAAQPPRDSSGVKDSRGRSNTQPPSTASTSSSSSHVPSRNIIPAHIKKDTNKLIDDLIHKAYGKTQASSMKTVVPAHSKKEITSVPDRTRESYQHVFSPGAFTAKQLTDPTSDIPKHCLQNNANETVAVLDLSKSRSVTSSSNNCPPNSKPEISQASGLALKETCSSSGSRRPDRRNSKGILSKRPRIMDNPYLQKVCAAGIKPVPGNTSGSGYSSEGSKMLKLESTEVSSMIDRLFKSVGESSGVKQDPCSDHEDSEHVKKSTPMETDNLCNEVTSSESPLSKLPVGQYNSLKEPRRVSPGGDNMVSSCDIPMEMSPTRSGSGNDSSESPVEGVVKEAFGENTPEIIGANKTSAGTGNREVDAVCGPLLESSQNGTKPNSSNENYAPGSEQTQNLKDKDSSRHAMAKSTSADDGAKLEAGRDRNKEFGLKEKHTFWVKSDPDADNEIAAIPSKLDTSEAKNEMSNSVGNVDKKLDTNSPHTETVLDPETGLFKVKSPKTESDSEIGGTEIEQDVPEIEDSAVNEGGLGGIDIKQEDKAESLENEAKSNEIFTKSESKNETSSFNDSDSYNFDDISDNSASAFFCKTWNFRERRYETDKSKADKKVSDSKLPMKSNAESENYSKAKLTDARKTDARAASDICVEGSDKESVTFPTYSSGSVFPGFDLDPEATSNCENAVDVKKEPSEISYSSTYTGKFVSDSEDTGSLPSVSRATFGSSRGRGAPRGRKGKRGRKKCIDIARPGHLCKKCGLSFAREGELERHKRSHLGQKLYVCEYCHKSFVRGYYYKLHVSLHEVTDAPSSPKQEAESENMDHSDTKEVSSSEEDSDDGDRLMEDSVSVKENDSDCDEKPLKELMHDKNVEVELETETEKSDNAHSDHDSTFEEKPSALDLVDGGIALGKLEVKSENEESEDSVSPLKISSIATLPESKPDIAQTRIPSPLPGPSRSSGFITSPPNNIKKSRTPSPVPSVQVPGQSSGLGPSPTTNLKKITTPSPPPGPSQNVALGSPVCNTNRNGNDVKKSNGICDAFLGVPVKDESLGLKISSVVSLPPNEEESRTEPKSTNSGLGQFATSGLKREFLDDISGADSLSRASILASAGLTVDTNITANYANSTMVTATPETDFSLILNTDPIPCTPSDFIFPDDEMFSNSPKEYLDLDTTTRPKASDIDPMQLLRVDNILKIEPNDQVVLNIKVETDVHFGALENDSHANTIVIKTEEPSEECPGPVCASPCSPLAGIDIQGLGSWDDDSASSDLEPVTEDLTYRPSLPDLVLKSLTKAGRKGIKKPRKAKFLHRFKCKQCTKDFARYGDLKKHESQHTGENLSICEICGKVFLRRCFYLIHLKRHQGGKFVHQQCGLRFPSKTAMKTHMRFCSKYKYCGRKGDTHFSLLKEGKDASMLPLNSALENSDKSDIENSENSMGQFELSRINSEREGVTDINATIETNGNQDNGEYSCDICGKQYMWLSALVYHKRLHTGEMPYKCPQCGKRFRAAGSLRTHIRYHNNERPFVCEICGKSYTERGTLKSHMKVHTGERKYKCEYCNKSFAWREHMRYHIKTHTGEKSHKCEECGKCFVDRSSLKIHWRSHSDARPFSCGICDMTYKCSKQLLIHRRIHTGETPYKCSACNMQFRALGNLKRHQMTHTKEKPLKCKFCTKMFRSHSNLSEHINIHTGNKPHECKLCKKKFANSGSLAKHIGTHSDEKRFECDRCKKCFRDKGDLKSHMRSHTDERPYACSICGQRFKHSCHVKKHMRTHNRQK
ncbi:uncharacterized protein LOC135483265 [Lineus longissimus]|uniref:uncharacterized protein LOC135483265 n=1 Tax=Lineus longissimus TaxID=88925 RepID=UPI002B4C9D86